MKEIKVTSKSPEETMEIAKSLLRDYAGISVIALRGELGAGKTCFVQGLAEALDIHEPITSPTFTIINEYNGTRPLLHMDLYRLSGADEVLDLGFEEYLAGNAVIAIEWPDRADELLPASTLEVELQTLTDKNARSILIRRND